MRLRNQNPENNRNRHQYGTHVLHSTRKDRKFSSPIRPIDAD
jgi:hypothetical protein